MKRLIGLLLVSGLLSANASASEFSYDETELLRPVLCVAAAATVAAAVWYSDPDLD